jgi:pantothenate kinase type III
MESGIYHLCRGGVQLLVKELGSAVECQPPVVVTGGDAELLLPLDAPNRVRCVPPLIFEGMRAAEHAHPERGQ